MTTLTPSSDTLRVKDNLSKYSDLLLRLIAISVDLSMNSFIIPVNGITSTGFVCIGSDVAGHPSGEKSAKEKHGEAKMTKNAIHKILIILIMVTIVGMCGCDNDPKANTRTPEQQAQWRQDTAPRENNYEKGSELIPRVRSKPAPAPQK
jgi:hypothetical protein